MAKQNSDWQTVYIGLGSNLGDPEANLKAALDELAKLPGCALARASSAYLTEPQGVKNQPWFANQVAQLCCRKNIKALELLQSLLKLEGSLGRIRDGNFFPNSPRVIDLDLLLFADQICNTAELVLPHPRMAQRAFVLIPLLEIAPGLRLPSGETAAEALRLLTYRLDGRLIYQE